MLLIIISFLIDIYSTFLKAKNFNTLWLANIYTISESIILIYFFWQIFQTKISKKIVSISVFVILSTWISQNIFLGKFNQLDNLSIGIESIILIILSLYYYFQVVRTSDDLMIYSRPNFWLVTAFLIYASGTFFLYISWNSLQKESKKESLTTSVIKMKDEVKAMSDSLTTLEVIQPNPSMQWLKKEILNVADSLRETDSTGSDFSLTWLKKELATIADSLRRKDTTTSDISFMITKIRLVRKHIAHYEKSVNEFDTLYSIINAAFLILKNLLLTVAFLLKEPSVTKKTLNQRTKFLDDLLKDD